MENGFLWFPDSQLSTRRQGGPCGTAWLSTLVHATACDLKRSMGG